jgi:hypothetical protein
VTIVKDSTLAKTQGFEAALGTEQSLRHHFFVAPGTKGIRVQSELLEGSDQGMSVSLFNASGVRLQSFPRSRNIDVFVSTPESGWYQVAVTKFKGGEQISKIRCQVTPLNTELDSEILDLSSGVLSIQNRNSKPIQAALEFRAPYSVIKSEVVRLKEGQKSGILEFGLRGYETKLRLDVKSLSATPFSYFDASGHSCLWNLLDGNEQSLGLFTGGTGSELNLAAAELTADTGTGEASGRLTHKVKKVRISCTVFENDDKTVLNSDLRLVASVRSAYSADATETAGALETIENWSKVSGSLFVTLQPGLNEVTLPALFMEKLRSTPSGISSLDVGIRELSLPQTTAQGSSNFVPLGRVELLRNL